MTRRFQFNLRALLVAVLVFAAFFGGLALQRQLDKPIANYRFFVGDGDHGIFTETIEMRDGTKWRRDIELPIE